MAMARYGLLPSFFSDVNKHTQVPVKGTLVTCLLAGTLAFFMDVEQLAGMVSVGTLLAFTMVAISVLTGGLIAKISDKIWIKQSAFKVNHNSENRGMADVVNRSNVMRLMQQEDDESGGFLKLKKTNEWIFGDTESAQVNKKMTDNEIRNDSEKKRRINFLKYEALKRELLLLTLGIETMCGGYCLVVFSFEVALSYAVGVFFSCLSLQMLWKYVDNYSKEAIPEIIMNKRS